MGWAIFFIIMAIGCIGVSVDKFAAGEIASGFGYLIFPVILFGVIISSVIIGLVPKNSKVKIKKQKQQKVKKPLLTNKQNKIDLNYWKAISEKAKNNLMSVEDIYNHIKWVFGSGKYSNIEEFETGIVKVLKGINSQGKTYSFMFINNTRLDFDSLADITQLVEEEKKEGSTIHYIAQNIENNVYRNLFGTCMANAGICSYTNQKILLEANKIMGNQSSNDVEVIEYETQPQIQEQPKYEKIFPHMMSSDDDPEELQELDDIMIMEELEEDDDFFDDMF